MRWKIGGAYYISEILSNPVFLAFVGLLIFGFSKAAFMVFGVAWLLKTILDYYVGYLIDADIKVFYYFLSPVKDIIMGTVWFVPFVNTKVYWRGKKYSIGKNTLLVESK
jgi:ceramide glucosyltransferase